MRGIYLVGADQKITTDWGRRVLITARNTRLHSLVVANKGTADFIVQVYDVTGEDEDTAGVAADATPAEFEVLCPAGSYVPFAFEGGWRCGNGCYVRCVTQYGGQETDLIGADDAKFTASFVDGPIL